MSTSERLTDSADVTTDSVARTATKFERPAGKLQGLARMILTPPFKFFWRITTEGLENLPDSGRAVLAPNHISVLDSFFIPLTAGRRMTYVGKAEYMDSWKTKVVFPAIGMIPIDRSGGDAAARALEAAASVLEAEELFGIYPEGTRSRNGLLHKGHTGVARIAVQSQAPIIPVGIIGSDEIQPPDARFPKLFRRVHIRFGKPIDVTKYSSSIPERLLYRQITDEVMFEIRNLTGQTYVDEYATKKQTPEAPVVDAPSEERLAKVISITDRTQVGDSAAESDGAESPAVSEDPTEIEAEIGRPSSASVLKARPLEIDLRTHTG